MGLQKHKNAKMTFISMFLCEIKPSVMDKQILTDFCISV